ATVTSDAGGSESGGFNNSVDSAPGTHSASASTQIRPVTDLQPSIPSSPATLQNGQTTSYVVQVTNNGTTSANNLASGAAKVLVAFNGANSSFAITTAVGCTPVTSGVSCVLGALNFGQNQQFTIVGTATLKSGSTSDTLTLTATVSPNNANDYFDNIPGNDNASANTLIKGVASLNLNLSGPLNPNLSGPLSPVLVGNSFSYKVTVSNAP